MFLSKELQRLKVKCTNKQMNIQELICLIGPRSKAIISLVFSIPFLVFIPLPGISTLFGLLIAICSYSVAFNKGIWFPKWALKKKVSNRLLSKVFEKSGAILRVVEKFSRPRGQFLSKDSRFERFNNFLVFFSALVLMLPLPPGTNFLPGLTIFLLSIGILEKDGVFVILGYIAFLVSLAFFIFLPILGIQAVSLNL